MLEKSFKILRLDANYTYEDLEKAYSEMKLEYGEDKKILDDAYRILKQHLDIKPIAYEKVQNIMKHVNVDLENYDDEEEIAKNKKRNYNRLITMIAENPNYMDIDHYLKALRIKLHNDFKGDDKDLIIKSWSDYSMYVDSKSIRKKEVKTKRINV